ncbi:DUF3916 domain-containing protein [Paenibacillus amylolyticus]|uniref:DUF3916 domain-containing protein n=1 Tax=Paenibacillus amylolyticus TaxID=1451 RepID=UPI00201DF124|nr:DUF3916 domain-containing protein [Paenibacillus amylolyticus]MCL6663485.1 DUF3916 domain-containing protein [Paenibacillus amylolyticus]
MNSKNKKARGARRNADRIIRRIEAYTEQFPEISLFQNDCWHLEMPASQAFLLSDQTPRKEKRRILQTMIDRAEHLMHHRPRNYELSQVMVVLDIGDLWSSQIIIGTEAADFDRFIHPINPNLRRVEQPDPGKLRRDWALNIPHHWQTSGFREFIRKENHQLEGEIWFAGVWS